MSARNDRLLSLTTTTRITMLMILATTMTTLTINPHAKMRCWSSWQSSAKWARPQRQRRIRNNNSQTMLSRHSSRSCRHRSSSIRATLRRLSDTTPHRHRSNRRCAIEVPSNIVIETIFCFCLFLRCCCCRIASLTACTANVVAKRFCFCKN